MRKLYALLFTVVLFAAVKVNGQVTVTNPTNTTPGLAATYTSLALAITDLNAQTAISGPVTITLTGNETAPAGGYSITAIPTGASASNKIIIQGSGSTITASAAHTAGSLTDAIFKLIGADFITIQNFTIQENAANTTTATATNNMTEWGVALLYASTTNGAQNNTIQNNTISLNRTYSNTFGIYSNTRHTATLATTAADITSASGSNHGNKVYNNAISDVDFGIVFIGSNAAAAMDNGNDIGGSSLATTNTITNWGGLVSGAASLYIGMTTASVCILMNHQINENVSYNTVTSATNITTLSTVGFIGILKSYFTTQPTGTITANYNNNTVTLTNSGATTSQMTGMGLQGLTTLATATFNCNNNNIINCAQLGSGVLAATMIGMLHSSAPGTFNINGNTIRGFSSNTTTTGGFIGIQQQTNGVVNALNINNNKIGDAIAGAVTFNNTTTTASVVGISVPSAAAATTCAVSITGNDFRGINYTTSGTGTHTYISNAAVVASLNVSSNTFTNLNVNTTGTVTFILMTYTTTSATATKTVNNNSIVTGFNRGGASGSTLLISDNGSSITGTLTTVQNNNFSNITVTGSSTITGINLTDGGTAPTKNISGNTLNNWTAGTGAINTMNITYWNGVSTLTNNTITNINGQGIVTGITIGSTVSTATSITVSGNTINNLSSTGTGGAVTGITCSNTSPQINITNNIINTLSSTGASAVNGIVVSGATSTSVFKNKIYDLTGNNAASTVNGLLISGGATVNAYNNLISDLKTPIGNSSTIDIIRGISITSTTASSNYYIYYNTVNLTAISSGTDFSTSGIYHAASATATTAKLDLRNNIIVNTSTYQGGGYSVVYRRSSRNLANYANTSNNNLFYAGTPSPQNLIYADSVVAIPNPALTISDYQNGVFNSVPVAPRDAVSISEDPEFQSTVGTNANFLKYKVTSSKGIESGGANITNFTDDYAGTIRAANPGYTGTGTAPDMGAWELNGIANYTCTTPTPGATQTTANNICKGNSVTLSLANPPSGTGVTYQWQSSLTGSGYTNISGALSSTYTITPTVATYYKCVVTCQNGPSSGTSSALQIVFANNVLTKTDSTRCGTGTVVLKATGNPGSTLNWYTDSIGGSFVGTGSPFTTPVISSTTNYYVGAEQAAPATVTLGAGSTTSTSYMSPFYHLYGGEKNQILIKASELQALGLGAGNINAVSMNIVSAGTSYAEFNMSIGTTALTALTTTLQTGLTNVYYNSSLVLTAGIFPFTFSAPFYWDGVSNIIIETCWSNNNTGGTSATVLYDNTSFVSTSYFRADSQTPAVLCATTAATGTLSQRPQLIFDGIAVCSSPRKAVTATVTTAAALTITGNQTVCNNSVATISVTSTLTDYNTYKWTPTTNLFTDLACTTPYVSGTNATTVYVKSAVADTTTYSCTSNNTTTLCANLATTKVYTLPATPSVAATTTKQQCLSGSTTFALTPATGYGAATIQWQSSTNNTSFTDVAGANAVTYTTPTLSTTTYYRVLVKIGASTCTTSNSDTIIVNSPSVVSKVDSFRCGTGPVTLKATGSAGTQLNWYTASSGGNSIYTGSPYVTPTISATTNYYVSASVGGTSNYTGAPNTTVSGFSGPSGQNSTTGAGIIFDVLNPNGIKINSVDVYPTGPIGSTISIGVFVGTSTVPVATYSTLSTVSGTTTSPVVQTIPVNFIIPAGTGYQMRQDATPAPTALLIRYSLATWQTYTVPGSVSLTGSVLSGYYYYFYNWLVSTGCESARTTVVATVNTPPAITPTASLDSICVGSSSSLNVTSSNAGYKYVWTPGPLNGAAQTVSPIANTTYTVTATDTTSGGPTSSCAAVGTKTISIKATPSAVTITPSNATKCAVDTVTLTASGGTVSNVTILSEGFESGAPGWTFEDSASTGTAIAGQIWHIETAPYTDATGSITFSNFSVTGSKFAYANADAGGSGSFTRTFMTSSAFSTVGFVGDATLTFKNLYKYWASSSPVEQVKVQITSDNGVTWNDLINYSGADVGTTTSNAEVAVTSTLTVPAIYMGQPSVKLRWRYLSNWGYVWVVDDVSLKGNASTNFTWTPTTSLTTTTGSVVKSFATSNITYTATSTNPTTNCTSSNTVTVSINPNSSIAYVSGGASQTVNLGRSINLIKYKVTNATGSSSVGLPAGVTAVLTADTIRISGTPTAWGVYNYKVIGTGLCRPDTLTGTITVDSCTIDWGNVQWPPSGTINNCGNYTVYARVYKAGYTPAPGADVGMQAWIGISTTNSNPSTWPESNWKLATFNVQVGNDDEYSYNFNNLDTGNYFIASRYKLPCSNFYFGGYNSTGGGGWNGTSNTSVTLRVNAIPAPVSGGNKTQCAQSPTIQTLTATATGSNVTWWTAATSGTKVTSPTLNTVGTITYYAQDSSSGCNSLARTPVTLTINPLPTVASLTGSGTICKGDSLQYTINFTGTAPWTFVVTHTGGSPNDTIAVPSNPFTIWDNSQATQTHTIIKLTDANTCVSSGTLASGTTTVTVVNPPTSGGNQVQCAQTPIQTLTAAATGSNVTWYTLGSGGTKVTSPTLNTVGSITYYAQDSANGCKSTTRTAVTLTINATPSAVTVTPNSFTQCTNSPAKKLSATGGVGAGTYAWTPTTGLYTDAAATTAYTGGGKDSVFARPGSTTKYTATSTNVSNCSSIDTSNIIVNCTLPVSYLNFAGVREAGNNVLRWTTSTEQNNKGFDVERSVDGKTFSSLGFVASKAANGNSNNELSYNFIDNQLTASVYYYRLRQVDLNGEVKYSNTIVIKGDRVNTIKMSGLYPNPATEEVTITIDAPNAEKVTLVVTDIYGKQIMQQQVSVEVGSNNTKLKVGSLSAGTYIVKLVSTKTSESSTLKFVKY